MVYKSVVARIIFYALFLIVGGAMITTGIIMKQSVLIILGVLVGVITTSSLVKYYNGINRKMTYLFDAMRSGDHTLQFSEKVKNKSTQQLNSSMNQVNGMIKDWKNQSAIREHFYLELIEHSTTGLVAFDNEGYVCVVNSIVKSYLQIHQNSNIKILRQKNNELYELMNTILPGQRKTIRILVNEEPVFLSLGLSNIKFEDKTYRLFSLKNIKHELDEKELDSWQKLIRVLTHEIMNSIAPITSLTATLSGFFKVGNKPAKPSAISQDTIDNTLEGLEIVEERGKGLIKFVESYRAITRLPEPVFVTVDLNQFFSKLLRLTESFRCHDNLELKVNVNSKQQIIADEELLMQAMINIVKNACEAVHEISQPKIEITATLNAERKSTLRVTDNGMGIPNEIIERIFVPFFTTKEDGSGIGLSICRQIMRLQNGSIGIKSEENVGTTVYLVFD